MHRIRLHSQWKRDTSLSTVSRFFRSFHSPTGLVAGDQVLLTATLAAEPTSLLNAISIQLNDAKLTPCIQDERLVVQLTAHLQRFNHLQLDLPPLDHPTDSSNPLWPLENLALEIHASPKTD